MKQILISGGSGFLGRHLVRRLLETYSDVRVKTISRGENDIQKLLTECPTDNLIPIYGDIKDIATLKYALKGVDVVLTLETLPAPTAAEQRI